MRASATCLEQPLARLPRGHAKIGDLDVFVAVQQQILGFEVAVANVEAMAVVDGVDDLLEIVQSFRYGQAAAFDEIVKQLAAGNILHDEVPVRGSVSDCGGACGQLEVRSARTARSMSPKHHTG